MPEQIASSLPISVVLVTWNSADVLPSCLFALAASVPPPAELIVIDNASTDDSRMVAAAFAAGTPMIRVRRLDNTRNRGFAAAVNEGIAASREPYVCLINPDVRLEPSTLPRLHAALAAGDQSLAVVGAKLRRATGAELAPTARLDSTGIVMTRDGRHFDRGAGHDDVGQFDREEEVFGITGALALFRCDALEASKVDGQVLDEDYFAFREDADLAWRLRGFGYRARYVPDAIAYHRRSVIPERRRDLSPVVNRHSVKNRFLLRMHHADRGWLLRFGWQSAMRDVIVIAACLTIERSSLPAFRWLIRNRDRHLARRREILARRCVSSADLRRWFA